MPLGMLFSLEFKAMPMTHSDNHDLDQLEEFMVICVRSCELTEQSAWKTASLTACLCVPRNWISVYEYFIVFPHSLDRCCSSVVSYRM